MHRESITSLGSRQQELLRALRIETDGLSVEEIATRLNITRTAVNQHLRALEVKGYVARGSLRHSGGRPSLNYLMTSKGLDLFPRQYSWFSALLVSKLISNGGSENLTNVLREIAVSVAESLKSRVQGKPLAGRLSAVAEIMEELGYEATASKKKSALPIIEAQNCVYHSLAAQHPEVCQFDLQLLETLSGATVHHESCMVRGGQSCRFRFKER
jgi:DeoR family transcriptional regulator, suf operon transcriptional repressor